LIAACIVYFLGFAIGSVTLALDGTATQDSVAVATLLVHNGKALVGLWSGIVTFGLGSLSALALNGTLMGAAFASSRLPLVERLLWFLPHALIEVPGLVLGGAAGLRPLEVLTRYLRGENIRERMVDIGRNTLIIVYLSVVLVVVGAFIEAVLTPIMLHWVK
jgi:stage II sporulation protein M